MILYGGPTVHSNQAAASDADRSNEELLGEARTMSALFTIPSKTTISHVRFYGALQVIGRRSLQVAVRGNQCLILSYSVEWQISRRVNTSPADSWCREMPVRTLYMEDLKRYVISDVGGDREVAGTSLAQGG